MATSIDSRFSGYLDALRAFFAVGVLASHIDEFGFSLTYLPFGHIGHFYVVGFFVLSGLVVTYSAVENRKSFEDYILARASRILSVSIPAVLVSLLLYWICSRTFQTGMSGLPPSEPNTSFELILILLFMSESWQAGLELVWNGPYWSICYEVWYYIFLGLFLYVPVKRRVGALLIAGLVAGPKVLLLLPCWLVGCLLYRSEGYSRLTRIQALIVAIASLVLIGTLIQSGVAEQIQAAFRGIPGYWRLDRSQLFVTDFVTALSFGLHLFAMRRLLGSLNEHSGVFRWIVGPLSKMSKYSFSIYLYHLPILFALSCMFPGYPRGDLYVWPVLLCVVALSFLLGRVSEDQKGSVRVALLWIRSSLVRHLVR